MPEGQQLHGLFLSLNSTDITPVTPAIHKIFSLLGAAESLAENITWAPPSGNSTTTDRKVSFVEPPLRVTYKVIMSEPYWDEDGKGKSYVHGKQRTLWPVLFAGWHII